MSVEWFLKLREMDSLSKESRRLREMKKEQEDRISKLEERRQEEILRTAKLKQTLVSLQAELADLEAKIKLLSEQKQRLQDMGGDEAKIRTYEGDISRFEEQGLTLLEQIDEVETEAQDVKTFLSGLEKTIQEISGEVQTELEKFSHELNQLDLRISALLEEIPAEFKQTLLKVSSKNLTHGPFTRVDQGHCFLCRYKISRILESEIDMQKSLKTCQQCGRIFLPYGA